MNVVLDWHMRQSTINALIIETVSQSQIRNISLFNNMNITSEEYRQFA